MYTGLGTYTLLLSNTTFPLTVLGSLCYSASSSPSYLSCHSIPLVAPLRPHLSIAWVHRFCRRSLSCLFPFPDLHWFVLRALFCHSSKFCNASSMVVSSQPANILIFQPTCYDFTSLSNLAPTTTLPLSLPCLSLTRSFYSRWQHLPLLLLSPTLSIPITSPLPCDPSNTSPPLVFIFAACCAPSISS